MRAIQTLEDLADDLVPNHFIENAPQFYGLIKSFLRNLQEVQESIDSNFLDTIDYERIKNSDYKKIYLDSYLAMFNLSEVNNYESLGEMIKVSKNLGEMKGTALIFAILMKMLIFIVPTIGNTYNQLLLQYNTTTDEIEKAQLEKQLDTLKFSYQESGSVIYEEYFDVDENLIPFKYKIYADITPELYTKYIRNFAHPAGWEDTFIPVYVSFLSDMFEIEYEGFSIFDMFSFPYVEVDGVWKPMGTSLQYPTDYYQRADIGPEASYASLIAKIVNIDNVIIDAGRVYYTWNVMSNPPTIIGTTGKGNTSAVLETPTVENFDMTYGAYSADTTNIGTANGCLTAGSFHIGYEIKADDKN